MEYSLPRAATSPGELYNASGIRTAKLTEGVLTGYLLDGGNVVAELEDDALSASYLRGANLISCTTSATEYYTFNAHGDVVGLVNNAGTQTKTYAYDAFGNEKDRVGSDPNPFRYCGEYFDVESGAYYLRARYYDPSVGRFTQEDATRFGLNWYAYCGNNPITFHDPTGCEAVVLDWREMGCGAVYGGVDLSYFQNILDALLRAGASLEQAVATLVNYLITPGPTVLTYQPMGPSLPISVGEAVPVADTVSGTDVAGGTASPSPDDPNGDRQRKRMEEKAKQYEIQDQISFKTKELLEEHFKRHGKGIAAVLEKENYTPIDYLNDANYIIQNGTYVPELNGYVMFMKGDKYGFVGLDRETGRITTFHIKKVSELMNVAPSLGLGK